MGRETFSRSSYESTTTRLGVPKSGSVTRRAEQEAHATGKLDPLVDPSGYDLIRRSLPRLEQRESDKLFELTVGTPLPIETRLDTTGSMGGNVNKAMAALPDLHERCSHVLPGYDLQIATGIFGDCVDTFVLCRPQFEMEAEKLVHQLTLMVPEGNGGGNGGEDPQYGLFGGAYLTDSYIEKIGLKGYDFTISDEPARVQLVDQQLKRIYGDEVYEKVKANGFDITPDNLPTIYEVVQDLLKRTHAFFLEVPGWYSGEITEFWNGVYGSERVITLPRIEVLTQVQAVIIGLTEGTFGLDQVKDFLAEEKVGEEDAKAIIRSVSNIPIGAQAALPGYDKRPQKGDLFKEKTDLWPISPSEVPSEEQANPEEESEKGPDWL